MKPVGLILLGAAGIFAILVLLHVDVVVTTRHALPVEDTATGAVAYMCGFVAGQSEAMAMMGISAVPYPKSCLESRRQAQEAGFTEGNK